MTEWAAPALAAVLGCLSVCAFQSRIMHARLNRGADGGPLVLFGIGLLLFVGIMAFRPAADPYWLAAGAAVGAWSVFFGILSWFA